MAERNHANQHNEVTPLVAGVTLATTKTHADTTATLTGGPVSAPVTFAFTMPGGGTTSIAKTTDGSGGAVASVTCSVPGTVRVNVYQAQATLLVAGPTSATVS
jgi:hypothetical protein